MLEESPTRPTPQTLPEQMHLVRTQMEELQRDVLETSNDYYRFAFNRYFKHVWDDTDPEEEKSHLVATSRILAGLYAKAAASAAQWADAMEESSKADQKAAHERTPAEQDSPQKSTAPAMKTTAAKRGPG